METKDNSYYLKKINEHIEEYSINLYDYIAIKNPEKIYKIINGEIGNHYDDEIEFLFLGNYYRDNGDHKNMKKYYLMASKKGYSYAMFCLGYYYDEIKYYKHMIRYYLMAIEKGNSQAMNNLAYYYETVKKDYVNMKKYYLMAIDKGNLKALNNLAYYYEKIKDYKNMEKYYIMATEKGDIDAMNSLGNHYYSIKDCDNMKKYYLMAIEKGNDNGLQNLYDYYIYQLKDHKGFFILLKKIKNKTQIINDKLDILIKERKRIFELNKKMDETQNILFLKVTHIKGIINIIFNYIY